MAANLPRPPQREWTVRNILLAILTILGVVIIFALFYRFYMVVFLFFIAFSLKVAFDPTVAWLQRWGLRREIGLLILYTLLAVLAALLIWLIAPPLLDQTRIVAGQLPALYSSVRSGLIAQPVGLVRGVGLVLPAEPSLPALMLLAPQDPAAPVSPWAMPLTALQAIFAFVSVFVMAYFWTLEGEVILRRLLLRIPAARRDEIRTLIAEIQGKINGYFRGQIVLCSSLGIVSAVAFFLIGVPNPLLLGLLMGIFEAVPVVGPLLGAIPALLMTASAAPDKIVWVLGAVIALQVAESNLLVPRVMDKAVGVNAVVSMLAIAAFGALFGFAGALLAVPLAAVLQILFTRLVLDPSVSRPAVKTPAAPRHYQARLQLQSQELAQDARKLARTYGERHDLQGELLIDEIEILANRLDAYLAGQEEDA